MDTVSSGLSFFKIIPYLFCILITFALPIIFLIIMAIKKDRLVKPFFIGVLTFTVFQILIRIPILQLVLPNCSWFIALTTNPILYCLFLGATASIFEELGRYITMKLFLKNNLRFNDGLSFGLGHWGIEALLLVGINTLVAMLFSPKALTSVNLFLAGIERLSTLAVHTVWSIMILYGIKNKKIIYLVIALIAHAFVDFLAGYLSMIGVNVYVIEGILFIFAICSLLLIIYFKKKWVNTSNEEESLSNNN